MNKVWCKSPPESALRPECNSTSMCGNVEIPFPFGIRPDCALPMAMSSGNFTISCNYRFNPPKPFIGNIEVLNISLDAGQIVVRSLVAFICYNSNSTTDSSIEVNTKLAPPYLISPTSNDFTAIGCDTAALRANNEEVLSYFTGCISYCSSVDGAAMDGDDCAGLGWCKAGIAANLNTMKIYWGNGNTIRPNYAWGYSPCSYAFVAKKGWYQFSRQDLTRRGNDGFKSRVQNKTIPLVLDWAIRSGSCVNVSGNLKGPACISNNSSCVKARNGEGYLCNCTEGYEGNPYVRDGCTNINECKNKNNPCGKDTRCEDTDGGFNCICIINRKGDGKSPIGCDQYRIPPYAIAAIEIFVAVIFGSVAIVLLQTRNNRKRFSKNGGKILETQGIKIYTKKELKKITNGYSKHLGGGHFGNVYRGSLTNGNKVAVKRSKVTSVPQRWKMLIRPHVPKQGLKEDASFINEIKFQFDARHENMVQLLGCCLESDIPMLVFEFISNGSLDDALHSASKPCTLSLLERLDIAIGSAEAIAYMHSLDNQKHVHGDIKPSNILLDDGLNPKVSDFGSSELLSVDSYYVRAVAGDTSYMDPLYVTTQHFTLECDVYSFGVVLLELITRKRARYEDNGDKILPLEFVRCFKDEGSRMKMYDTKIDFSGADAQSQRNRECLDRIGKLAVRCLNREDKRERPTMAEVVRELKQVKVIAS